MSAIDGEIDDNEFDIIYRFLAEQEFEINFDINAEAEKLAEMKQNINALQEYVLSAGRDVAGKLSDSKKKTIIKWLEKISQADGIVASEESGLLNQIRDIFGIG
jgi:uncharacterized tellurite resistance protein B-like protein